MKGIPNNTSPGNDGLTKELYETFWDELKDSFINSIKLAYQKKALTTSQHQAVIKLIEKNDRDKTLLKNWKPISLLNVDLRDLLPDERLCYLLLYLRNKQLILKNDL